MSRTKKDTDAIIKVIRACVCGSDLWWYRGLTKCESGSTVGHEAIGIVEEVGSAVKNVKPGDFVIAPFMHGCVHCAACLAGFDGNCLNQENGGNGGYQGEYLRFTNANWALVKVPGKPTDYTDEQLNSLLTLAEVKPGDTVVVMGDGAVGLCRVIVAKLYGAKRIIAMSRHADRQKLAQEFGATDIVAERGDEAVDKVLELTEGAGADAVLECVGTEQSVDTAVKVGRPGAIVGRVGVPQKEEMNINALFWKNIGLRGEITPGKVFTKRFTLDEIQAAYEAMDKREAIKSLLTVAE